MGDHASSGASSVGFEEVKSILPEQSGTSPSVKILVLDDEPTILVLLARILEREGYEVLTAATGNAALAALASHREGVALLVVDVKLPDMSGREFVHHAAARFGDRPILYVSGVDQRGRGDTLHQDAVFLPKPFDSAELMSRVRTLLGSHNQSSQPDK